MIIKASRIKATSGANALAQHLMNGADNEAVVVIRGTMADLSDAVADAKRFNRTHALRHFIIAPEREMTLGQFEQSLAMIANEFGFDPTAPVIVEHCKARAVEGVATRHWHVVVPEVDGATGTVLSNRHDRARHEKIARSLELLFGHPINPGAHDMAVLASLRQEGRSDLADKLADWLGLGDRPKEAFTTATHQAAKREGLDLADAKLAIRTAWRNSKTTTEFRSFLAHRGMSLDEGEKAGTWIIRKADSRLFLGAAHRLLGIRKADLITQLAGARNDDYPDSRDLEQSAVPCPEDIRGHYDHARAVGHDTRAGTGDGSTDGRGGEVLHRNGNYPATDDRSRHRIEPPESGSTSPAFRPTRHRYGAEKDGRDRLTATISMALATLAGLTKSGFHHSSQERTKADLAKREAEARAGIAAIRSKNAPEPPKGLTAARLYQKGAEARHDALWQQYRALQKEQTTSDQPHGFWARLRGTEQKATALEQELATVKGEIAVAERAIRMAIGNVNRCEKEYAAQKLRHTEALQAELRTADLALKEVQTAQWLMRTFPPVAFAGPTFTAWAGEKIFRRRRNGLRTPQARNIWGLPIEP